MSNPEGFKVPKTELTPEERADWNRITSEADAAAQKNRDLKAALEAKYGVRKLEGTETRAAANAELASSADAYLKSLEHDPAKYWGGPGRAKALEKDAASRETHLKKSNPDPE